MAQGLRFNCMHFMPYAHLPENHKDYKSVWVNLSNKHYDPEKGHALYQRYLSELVLADQLGYDAVVVNEHHNTVYSMMATPNLIAAALVPQTKRAKICVWGTPPNLMLPNRLAEEYAILDVMSNGRLEVAFPLGTGMEYWANPVSPATAREKFRESLKIILQAWTADGPTTHYGDALHLSLPQSVAAADAAPASALLHRRHRQPGDDRHRRRIRLWLRLGVRHARSGRASSTRTCASVPPISAIPSGRSSFRS